MAGRGISAFGPDTFHMKRSGRKLHLWSLNAPAILWGAVAGIGPGWLGEPSGPREGRSELSSGHPRGLGGEVLGPVSRVRVRSSHHASGIRSGAAVGQRLSGRDSSERPHPWSVYPIADSESLQ